MADTEATRGPRRRPVVIDFHAHIANEEVNAATYGLSVLGQTARGAAKAPPSMRCRRRTGSA